MSLAVNGDAGLESAIVSLEDDCSRCILVHAYEQPMSVQQLASRCDTSQATIYRRVEVLQEHDLLTETIVPDEDGHHYRVYQTTVTAIRVSISDDGFDVDIDRRESMVDRLTRFIETI